MDVAFRPALFVAGRREEHALGVQLGQVSPNLLHVMTIALEAMDQDEQVDALVVLARLFLALVRLVLLADSFLEDHRLFGLLREHALVHDLALRLLLRRIPYPVGLPFMDFSQVALALGWALHDELLPVGLDPFLVLVFHEATDVPGGYSQDIQVLVVQLVGLKADEAAFLDGLLAEGLQVGTGHQVGNH